MDVNEAIDLVGGFGPFQVQICVINFFKEVIGAFHMIGLVFIALVPEHVDCISEEIIESSYFTIVNEVKARLIFYFYSVYSISIIEMRLGEEDTSL